MATIKSYTTKEQSRKLAKILPIESADMRYQACYDSRNNLKYIPKFVSTIIPLKADIPCWSLAALLGVLPDYTLQTNTDGTVFVVCESKKPIMSDAYDNPLDACVDMITKLHEMNLL